MDGVRVVHVRTELFRRQPTTFIEAVHIALLEDHCMRSAQGHVGSTDFTEGPRLWKFVRQNEHGQGQTSHVLVYAIMIVTRWDTIAGTVFQILGRLSRRRRS